MSARRHSFPVSSTCCSCSAGGCKPLVGMNPVSAVDPSLADALAPTRLAPRNLVPHGLERFTQGPLPKQALVERISPMVTCVLGQNPSNFTLNGTNIYIVGNGKRRILIDAGERPRAPQVISVLEGVFKEQGIEGLDGIICTHLHHDHVGGAQEIAQRFGPCPISKFPAPQSEVDSRMKVVRAEQRRLGVKDPEEIPPAVINHYRGAQFEQFGYQRKLAEGEVVHCSGGTLRIFHTPGHASDHIVIMLEEERALFTGDHILGWGTSWVEDLSQYVASLNKIQAMHPLRLYPGHGPCVYEAMECVARYLSHREERENQVLEVLYDGTGAKQINGSGGVTAQDLVQRLYPNTLDARALGNVEKILRKLEKEGVITRQARGVPMAEAQWFYQHKL